MGLFIHDHPENRGCYKKDYRLHDYYENEEDEEDYHVNSTKTSESYDYESTYQITLRKFRKKMVKQVEKLNSKEILKIFNDFDYDKFNEFKNNFESVNK